MSACVLTCFRVYGDLQDKKLVKYMPKIKILSPLNPEFPIWCLSRNLRQSVVIYGDL